MANLGEGRGQFRKRSQSVNETISGDLSEFRKARGSSEGEEGGEEEGDSVGEMGNGMGLRTRSSEGRAINRIAGRRATQF